MTYDPGYSLWSELLASPELYVDVGLSSLSLSGPPLVSTGWVEVGFDVTETATVELAELPMLSTCTSPANATGQAGSLDAYGSVVAGEDWLTIRATGLPDDQFGLLFVGTEPGFAPSPTGNFNLCLGGTVARVNNLKVTENGLADFELDLAGKLPGEAVYVQVLHRDPQFGTCATEAGAFFVE